MPPDVAARTFTYRVTGTKGLLDLVTIVYTDAQGGPQTDFNVSLPWSKTVVMNPGVQIRSVVATSLTGHLNCSITDGDGSARRDLDQQRDDRGPEPLGQTQFAHPLVVGALQPVEEPCQLRQAVGPRHHEVDQLVVFGQHVLGLRDRFAEQTT